MTYSDFITLMMIFFIVVYTLTPGVERVRFEEFVAPFQGSRAIIDMPEDGGIQVSQDLSIRMSAFDRFMQVVEDLDAQDDVTIEFEADFIRITLQEPVSFNTYSSVLLERSRLILRELARVVESFEAEPIHRIYVNGHTDNVPIRAGAPRYQSNWELGGARATSVINFLVESGDLSELLFVPSSFAEHNPVTSNDTPQGRAQNRRVELLLHFGDNDLTSSNQI